MSETIVHRVDGVGRQLPPDEDQPFNPRTFEQAIHGLQKLIIDIGRIDRCEDNSATPEHELSVEDGQSIIRVQPDTTLHDVCLTIPRGWDVSALTDQVIDDSYAVRASADCGGEVLVYATVYVQDGWLRRMDVGHSDIVNPDETMEVTGLNHHSSSRVLTQLNRTLERDVMKAYAHTIDSAATAFDFTATREDIPPEGGRPPSVRDRRATLSQKEWAEARGKTSQRVRDNVRDARQHLDDIPDTPEFDTSGPALEELDQDGDDPGDIRLV